MGKWKTLRFSLLVSTTIILGIAIGGVIVGGLSRYGSFKPCAIIKTEAIAAINRELAREIRLHPSLAGLQKIARSLIRSAVDSELRKRGYTQLKCARIGIRFLTQDSRQVIRELFPEIASFEKIGGSFKRLGKSLENIGRSLKNWNP